MDIKEALDLGLIGLINKQNTRYAVFNKKTNQFEVYACYIVRDKLKVDYFLFQTESEEEMIKFCSKD